jgi:tetratricopeptide (TPR) repeat protein
MLDQETLDELWDFDDPTATEARLRVELEQGGPYDEVERAELRTQLARALGLQERYDDAAEMLIEVESEDAPVVIARVLLESGRILNSAGKPDDAAPLFLRAAEIGAEAMLAHVTIDALHMLAIAKPSNAEHWTARAVDLAEASPDARTQRWLIPLHVDLGWNHFESGEFDAALAEFTEAARWADLVGTAEERQETQEAIAECSAAMASDQL